MTTFTTEDRLHAGEYPLTDEQIKELMPLKPYEEYTEMEAPDLIAFARAIERAHGIGELP
jgi:hypothetical protein